MTQYISRVHTWKHMHWTLSIKVSSDVQTYLCQRLNVMEWYEKEEKKYKINSKKIVWSEMQEQNDKYILWNLWIIGVLL